MHMAHISASHGKQRRRSTLRDRSSPNRSTASPAQHPVKGSKPNPEALHLSNHRRRARFFDGLSKIHLTRGSLKEFNRRTPRPANPSPPDCPNPVLEGLSVDRIKYFARHGGANLCNLRGVSSWQKYTRLLLTTCSVFRIGVSLFRFYKNGLSTAQSTIWAGREKDFTLFCQLSTKPLGPRYRSSEFPRS
jgi:hypothetical protein